MLKRCVHWEYSEIGAFKDKEWLAVVTSVTPDTLQRTWAEVDYRHDVSKATNTAHIETYQSI